MSLIENALKKLQGSRPTTPGAEETKASRGLPATSVPEARRKKVIVEGPKYHVDQAALVKSGLLAPSDQALPIADEFRKIKRPLIANAFQTVPEPAMHANVIMITSPLPGAGKTFCAVNLARSLSLERDINVVLVDADVAKPHITREFGLSEAPGLIDLLLDDGDVAELLIRTDLNDVQILPAGRSHPQATELLASERMSRLVHELSIRYPDRMILLDSPPLLITSEAQALASQVGQITMIVEAGQTTHQQLTQAIEGLNTQTPVNVVLNKSRSWGWLRYHGEYGYGYGYGHGHGQDQDQDQSLQ